MNKHLLEENDYGHQACKKCKVIFWSSKEIALRKMEEDQWFIHSRAYKDLCKDKGRGFIGFAYRDGNSVFTINEFTSENIGEDFCRYSDEEYAVKQIIE